MKKNPAQCSAPVEKRNSNLGSGSHIHLERQRRTKQAISIRILVEESANVFAYETVSDVHFNSSGIGFPASSLASLTSKSAAKVAARMKTELLLK
jgi:hypothetical protein